jgi:hypothetical protein
MARPPTGTLWVLREDPLLRVREPRFLASAGPENEWRNGCATTDRAGES